MRRRPVSKIWGVSPFHSTGSGSTHARDERDPEEEHEAAEEEREDLAVWTQVLRVLVDHSGCDRLHLPELGTRTHRVVLMFSVTNEKLSGLARFRSVG